MWVGGGWFLSENITTSLLHLASWDLPDFQISWESKMEPSVATSQNRSSQDRSSQDRTSQDKSEYLDQNHFRGNIVFAPNFSLDPNFFLTQPFFRPKTFLDPNVFQTPKFFYLKFHWAQILRPKNFWIKKIFWTQNFVWWEHFLKFFHPISFTFILLAQKILGQVRLKILYIRF